MPRSEAHFVCWQAFHVTVSTYRCTRASIANLFSEFAAQKGKDTIKQNDPILPLQAAWSWCPGNSLISPFLPCRRVHS